MAFKRCHFKHNPQAVAEAEGTDEPPNGAEGWMTHERPAMGGNGGGIEAFYDRPRLICRFPDVPEPIAQGNQKGGGGLQGELARPTTDDLQAVPSSQALQALPGGQGHVIRHRIHGPPGAGQPCRQAPHIVSGDENAPSGPEDPEHGTQVCIGIQDVLDTVEAHHVVELGHGEGLFFQGLGLGLDAPGLTDEGPLSAIDLHAGHLEPPGLGCSEEVAGTRPDLQEGIAHEVGAE